MLEDLKEQVLEANLELVRHSVVIYTWGNVSGIDRNAGKVVIKPSGVPYEELTAADMVVVDFETGSVVDSTLYPSSDTPTHLALYNAFDAIGGITHTHSTYAVAFSQAGMEIPVLGTTHADYFYGAVSCTRGLSPTETEYEYEHNTGVVIAEAFEDADYTATPGILVHGHGPFAWGKDAAESAHNAIVLEEVAKMAYLTLMLNESASLDSHILDKHYNRKHGSSAYYGQHSD